MAIKSVSQHSHGGTYIPDEPIFMYPGRVIEVRTFVANRNMSDTLDYSDHQHVKCTEALVWRGLTDTDGSFMDCNQQVLDFHKQFVWVDCSNHFGWRGCDIRTPEVDAFMDDPNTDPMMWVNYIAWKSHVKAEAERIEAKRNADAEADRVRKQEEIKNRPEVGKQMKVVKGRILPKGTTGTVAFVSGSRVLLKDDSKWQDRKADGIWIPAASLAAR